MSLAAVLSLVLRHSRLPLVYLRTFPYQGTYFTLLSSFFLVFYFEIL